MEELHRISLALNLYTFLGRIDDNYDVHCTCTTCIKSVDCVSVLMEEFHHISLCTGQDI